MERWTAADFEKGSNYPVTLVVDTDRTMTWLQTLSLVNWLLARDEVCRCEQSTTKWVDGLDLVSAQLLLEQLSNPDLVSGLWAFHLPAEEHLPWIVVEGESSSPNGSPKEMFLGPTLKLVFSRLVACLWEQLWRLRQWESETEREKKWISIFVSCVTQPEWGDKER